MSFSMRLISLSNNYARSLNHSQFKEDEADPLICPGSSSKQLSWVSPSSLAAQCPVSSSGCE